MLSWSYDSFAIFIASHTKRSIVLGPSPSPSMAFRAVIPGDKNDSTVTSSSPMSSKICVSSSESCSLLHISVIEHGVSCSTHRFFAEIIFSDVSSPRSRNKISVRITYFVPQHNGAPEWKRSCSKITTFPADGAIFIPSPDECATESRYTVSPPSNSTPPPSFKYTSTVRSDLLSSPTSVVASKCGKNLSLSPESYRSTRRRGFSPSGGPHPVLSTKSRM
mmetsp:Transcript_17554/g.51204  ORF Transcript_17554/g.51204 Transcript_17554/m.51204 type:complete len:220 (+) Transcript_17554:450-1109(+)